MAKPKITYSRRYTNEGIRIDRYEDGIGYGNPVIIVPDELEEMTDRIVFFEQMKDALIEANDYIIENAPDDIYPEQLLNKLEQTLKRVGVEL